MQRIYLSIGIVGALLLSSSFAYASDAGHLPWGNFIWRVVTFAGFIAVIAYFFGSKIKGFFKGRTEGITTELTSLESRKVTAQKNLAEVEQRIAALETERQAILAEYVAQGEQAKALIIAEAEKAAEGLMVQAKNTARNEIDQAIKHMREEMAEKIIAATEAALAKKLSVEEQTKLVDNYLTKVVLN